MCSAPCCWAPGGAWASAGDIAFYAYIVPFLISTAVGAVIAGVLVYSLQHSGALRSMQSSLS